MIYSIYEDFMQSAKMTTKNAKMILRHSLRGDIRRGEVGLDVLLTREGKILAEHFGKHCEFDIAKIFTSHIQRCVQTARYFAKGYAQTHHRDLEITSEPILAECYIQDIPKAQELFKSQSPYNIMSAFLRGESLPGIRDLHSTMQILFSFIFHNDCEDMELFITHDTFLIAIICFCHDINHITSSDSLQSEFYSHDKVSTNELWPYMLEGAFLQYDSKEKSISCIYRGVKKSKEFDLHKN